MKKTIILGASSKPERYSAKALKMLKEFKHEVVAFGAREDELEGIKIHKKIHAEKDVHTITLYLNPTRQKEYYDFILEQKPQRVLFNPGTENKELQRKLEDKGILYEEACTLVLLRTGAY